jgi:hypothetical protein
MLTLARRGESKIPYSQASAHYYNALKTLKEKSPTAASIIDFVENKSPAVQISILVTDVEGAFGPFDMELGFTGPCIVWTPGKSFTTRGANITGYRPNGTPMIAGKKVEVVYPSEIVLLHEIGHAKQFIENPGWFSSMGPDRAITSGSKSVAEIEADNLRRHEHPVCREYGLAQRQNYVDFLNFNDVAVPTKGRLY